MTAQFSSRMRRVWFKLDSRTLELAGAGGIIGVLVGVAIGTSHAMGLILIGLGTSIFASVLVGGIALGRDQFMQQLLGDGVQDVFVNRNTRFEDTFWTDLIREARSHFRVLGTANHGYIADPAVAEASARDFTDAIVKHDVKVEFLWLNPDSDLAPVREREEHRTTRLDTCNAILFFWKLREELAHPRQQERLILKEYNATPSCGVTWVDDLMIVTQYMAGNPNLRSPGMVLGKSHAWLDRPIERLLHKAPRYPPITNRYIGNFDAIRQGATPISSERIREIEQKQSQLDQDRGDLKSEAELRKELSPEETGST
ncbi:MAG TPA: hypothetical protein VGG98_08910 [Solirubrobacteraceae bacterium]|jgi:hypothetical protein